MRNPSIGYCQGFNYIVGKMLLVIDNEEDVFWLFTELCENYLPFDFYITFCGVRTDMEILKKIIKKTIQDIDINSELCISNLITKCLISLFSQNVKDTILYTIWDYFFIYGNIILYRSFIWCIYLLYDKELRKQPIDVLNTILLEKLAKEEDLETLCYFLTMYIRVGDNFIEYNRKKVAKKVIENSYNDSDFRKKDQICNPELPYCLYDKGLKGDEEVYCLQASRNSYSIIDNYFFENKDLKKEQKEINIDSMVVERQFHACSINNK